MIRASHSRYASARHTCLAVAVGSLMLPHWWPPLRSAGHDPATYVLALLLAVCLLSGWALRAAWPRSEET